MTTAKEYREFAIECLRWATEVESEEDKQAFLDMARDWMLAAMRLEGVLTPDNVSAEPASEAPASSVRTSQAR